MTKRFLVSAFACAPNAGSEPYVGWQWIHMLAAHFEVHVITRSSNRQAIEAAPEVPGVIFHYVDVPLHKHISGTAKTIKFHYLLWQIAAFKSARTLHSQFHFHYSHQLTYNTIDAPSFLWSLKGTKFIWGPVGGGQVPPNALKSVFSEEEWIKQRMRTASKRLVRYNPFVRMAARRARIVLFANEDTAGCLKGLPTRSDIMLETAISHSELSPCRTRPKEFNVLWIGRIEPRKALNLAIDVLERAIRDVPELRLEIIGDGPSRHKAEDQVRKANLDGSISFLGKLSREQVLEKLTSASVLLFTSVQDTSGNVVLEAMAAGTPVVALDHQGVKEMITYDKRSLVKPTSYEETCTELASRIVRMFWDEEEWSDISDSHRREVFDRHTWRQKEERFLEIVDGLDVD